jgi:hypothetical protein
MDGTELGKAKGAALAGGDVDGEGVGATGVLVFFCP